MTEIIALTLDMAGKIMVSYTALAVHHRFWQEHKIDEAVFKTMKWESRIGVLGVLLMVAGYIFHLLEKLT